MVSKENELDLAKEFLRNPEGPHSEALKRLLREFRGAPARNKYVLVEDEPYRSWRLGRLSGTQSGGVELVSGVTFSTLSEAERHVFRLRWNESGRTPHLSEES